MKTPRKRLKSDGEFQQSDRQSHYGFNLFNIGVALTSGETSFENSQIVEYFDSSAGRKLSDRSAVVVSSSALKLLA